MRRQFGSVRQRKGRDGWFISIRRDGRNYTRRAASTKKKAEQVLAKVWVLCQDGASVPDALSYALNERPAGALTWKQVVAKYLEWLETIRTDENKKKETGRSGCILKSGLARAFVTDTDRATAARWIDTHRNRTTRFGTKTSPKTLNRYLSFASSVWQWCEERGYATGANPFRQVKRSREIPLDKTPLRADELMAVVEHASEEFLPLLLTAGSTGMRAGELRRLTWADVNFDESVIWVRVESEKTNRGRVVPMTDGVREALQAIRPQDPIHPTRRVFLRANGKPWTNWTFGNRMESAVKGAQGADKLRPHARHDLTPKGLRDAFITNLALLGVGWEVYGKLAGHANASTSRRYLGIAQEVQRDAIDLLGSRLGSPRKGANAESA
ncbi:MAG: tyrosine-type recombinase/integrase [Planctomycetota bacterium]